MRDNVRVMAYPRSGASEKLTCGNANCATAPIHVAPVVTPGLQTTGGGAGAITGRVRVFEVEADVRINAAEVVAMGDTEEEDDSVIVPFGKRCERDRVAFWVAVAVARVAVSEREKVVGDRGGRTTRVYEAERETVLETVGVTTPHCDAATLIPPSVKALATANEAIELL
jgi:hypothetical protein